MGVSNYPKFHSDVVGGLYSRPPKRSPSIISQWQQGLFSMAKDFLSRIKPGSLSFQSGPPPSPHLRIKRNYGPNDPLSVISKPENALDPIPDDGLIENAE